MRGEQPTIGGLPQAMAVVDLVLAGVSSELSEEMFDWQAVPQPRVPQAGGVVTVESVPSSLETRTAMPVVPSAPAVTPLMPQASKPTAATVLAEPVRSVAMPEVQVGEAWSDGASNGVVLVVQGGRPDSRCVALAQAMLASVGLANTEIGWVGYSHKVEAKDLLEHVTKLVPQQVLVLGQGPLGILLGRNLGVEGWHAAATGAVQGIDVAVGVTYPLELLLKQPLFKRLAWQHLLAWGEQGFSK